MYKTTIYLKKYAYIFNKVNKVPILEKQEIV